jgi:hypothetical protein
LILCAEVVVLMWIKRTASSFLENSVSISQNSQYRA